jgi:hypothetical protein
MNILVCNSLCLGINYLLDFVALVGNQDILTLLYDEFLTCNTIITGIAFASFLIT